MTSALPSPSPSPQAPQDPVATPERPVDAIADPDPATGSPFESREDLRIVLWAAALGLSMGALALAFIVPIHALERLWEGWAVTSRPRLAAAVMLAPALGGLLCAAVLWLFPLSVRGHGVSTVLYAVARNRSQVPFRLAIRQWLASTATIVSGGSAGPEGPIAAIGSAIGSTLGRITRLKQDAVTTLLGAGAAAGIAAVFNAPIAGVFFALEVLLRDFSIRTFAPIVVAAVLASAATQMIVGVQSPILSVDPSQFDGMRGQLSIAAAPAFALLGVACGVAAVGFMRLLRASERRFAALKAPAFLRPAIGGLLLGLLGLAYLVLNPLPEARPEGVAAPPAFMGNGYRLIGQLLDREFYLAGGARSLAGLLLLWLLLKGLATGFTLGSGGSGGLFAPSLLIGALAGGAFGLAVRESGLVPGAEPVAFALVGMAGLVAATTHAPLCGMMLAYEVTGDYTLILPLMLAATIATLVARSLDRYSIYTAVLAEQGVRVGTHADRSLLRRLSVRDVTLAPAVPIRVDESAERLLAVSERCEVGELVVLDREDRYVGLVGGAELRAALLHQAALPLMQVGELMRTGVPAVRDDDSLEVVLDRFAAGDFAALPVIDASGHVEGLLSRERLMRRYQRELDRDA